MRFKEKNGVLEIYLEGRIDSQNAAEFEAEIMKAMDSYGSSSEPFRIYTNDIRRILVRQYMRADQDNWLRFRQILEGSTLYMSIDYIELCPKDVYDNPEGEDRH